MLDSLQKYMYLLYDKNIPFLDKCFVIIFIILFHDYIIRQGC